MLSSILNSKETWKCVEIIGNVKSSHAREWWPTQLSAGQVKTEWRAQDVGVWVGWDLTFLTSLKLEGFKCHSVMCILGIQGEGQGLSTKPKHGEW